MCLQKEVYPRLAPHQKIFVVPGTFACSNLTYMPLAQSSRSVVEKLKAYFAWGKEDPRMAGINPWVQLTRNLSLRVARAPFLIDWSWVQHFSYRDKPQHPPPCDMELGAGDMP